MIAYPIGIASIGVIALCGTNKRPRAYKEGRGIGTGQAHPTILHRRIHRLVLSRCPATCQLKAL